MAVQNLKKRYKEKKLLNRGKKRIGKRDQPEEKEAFWLALLQHELARGSGVELDGPICNV